MSDVAQTGQGAGLRPEMVSVAVAILGAAALALLAIHALGAPVAHFGMDIYDQTWLALREGRLDLPARVLRLEGHYTPDGTGYSYHGVAPLITRMLFDPVMSIGAQSLAPLSIWLWTVIGTGFWQGVIWQASAPARAAQPERAAILAGILGASVWIAGPAVLLVANHALYHEPIALAYAMAAIFSWLWIRAERSGHGLAGVLVLLALCAAVALHARPNVAVGLYAATGFAGLRALWQVGARALLPGVLAAAILGAGGAGYLALNAAKFGNAAETHGSFEAGDVQYGTVYWGYEPEDGVRSAAFVEHGRFNAVRILPNAVLYYLGPPQLLLVDLYDDVRTWHHEVTRDVLGFIRVEGPGGGVLGLWTLWAWLAVLGAVALRHEARPYWGLLAGLGASSLLTLSYGTVTLRYQVDLFPLVMVLAAVGLLYLAPRLTRPRDAARWPILFLMLTIIGGSVSLRTADAYGLFFRQHADSAFAEWTDETCREKAAERGFDPGRIEEICRPPRQDS